VNNDARLLARESFVKNETPPMSGIAKTFFSNALRRSSFASMEFSSVC